MNWLNGMVMNCAVVPVGLMVVSQYPVLVKNCTAMLCALPSGWSHIRRPPDELQFCAMVWMTPA